MLHPNATNRFESRPQLNMSTPMTNPRMALQAGNDPDLKDAEMVDTCDDHGRTVGDGSHGDHQEDPETAIVLSTDDAFVTAMQEQHTNILEEIALHADNTAEVLALEQKLSKSRADLNVYLERRNNTLQEAYMSLLCTKMKGLAPHESENLSAMMRCPSEERHRAEQADLEQARRETLSANQSLNQTKLEMRTHYLRGAEAITRDNALP
jgi:hypothetical protein